MTVSKTLSEWAENQKLLKTDNNQSTNLVVTIAFLCVTHFLYEDKANSYKREDEAVGVSTKISYLTIFLFPSIQRMPYNTIGLLLVDIALLA